MIVDLAHLNEIVSIDFNCVKVYLKSKKVVAKRKLKKKEFGKEGKNERIEK